MAFIIRAFFSFWFGILLTYQFAGVKFSDRKIIIKMLAFCTLSILIQLIIGLGYSTELGEKLYPIITHLPLILWLIFVHKIKWEISVGAVVTAYLCCEFPDWISQFGSIPFNNNYNINVLIYCISCVTILYAFSKNLAPSIYSLLSKSRQLCLMFMAVPFLYYLWSYSSTVYSSYLKQYGYEVAFTMSALFSFLYLLVAIVQNKRFEDEEIMNALKEAKDAEQKAKQEAIRANKAKGDFLANMSHEIRTPINTIIGFDEIILRECSDPTILEYAQNIKTSSYSLLALINDILDLSKIESERMELHLAEYEIKELISDVLLMIEPRIDAKGLKLKYVIDSRIPKRLLGDDLRIRQILINLLSNAVKYTKEGQVTLSVSLIKQDEKNVSIKFSVKDTGIGIKKEDQQVLFEAFRRVDLGNNKGIEGTGLGLSISTKLLQLMNSNLELESIYGLGSDFSFEIWQEIVDSEPIGEFVRSTKEITGTEEKREALVAPNAKILAVDDNKLNLLVLKGLLNGTKMNIKLVRSAQEALDLIYKEYFDIVFMDHLMPNMDGIEALDCILKDDALRKNAPVVIALTANAIAGAKETYMQAGFSDYLKKPIMSQELEDMIRLHLPKELIQSMDDNMIEEVIDQKVGMTYCAGDKEFYREVLNAFIQSEFPSKLNDYFENEDWKGYQIAIHGVKSGAKSIGAIKISDLAFELEMALKERNDVEMIKANHETVMLELEKVEKAIQVLVTK